MEQLSTQVDTMTLNKGHNTGQTSHLLRLPREIRDAIYEYALVRTTIPIECAVTKVPQSRVTVGGEIGFCEALYQDYKLTYPLDGRSAWSIPLIDLAIPESDHQLDSSVVFMTYQLANMGEEERPECQLLQICKQIYAEAGEVLYGRNVFSFSADFRIPTALTFLRDRPTGSLGLVAALELHLTEASNTSGSHDSHHPIVPQAVDSLVLQYAYGYFSELCTLLSSSQMRLRKLFLSIETFGVTHVDATGRTLPRGLVWGDRSSSASPPCNASWVDPLLKINCLNSISVFWIFNRPPGIQRMADTVALMRKHMLEGGQCRNNRNTIYDNLHIKVRVLEEGDYLGAGVVITFDSNGGFIDQRDCTIYDDGTKFLELAEDDDRMKDDPPKVRQLVQEFLGSYHFTITCYCELGDA